MNNNLLTPDRIDVARALFKNHIEMLEHELDILPDEEICADVTREEIEHHETAIAALEFVEQFRWRDPEVELPPLEKTIIAIDENGEICLGEMYTRVYWNSDDPLACPNPRVKFSYSDDRYEANCDLETLQAWMPLLEWEGGA